MAQTTQYGYVKTKGRMDKNGNIIHGERIPNVAIELRNGHSTVSDNDGTFSILISNTNRTFAIKDIHKNGYYLFDPDVLLTNYYLSPNPFEVVMVDKKQEEKDKWNFELQIKTNYYNKLSARNDSIENLKNQLNVKEEQIQELEQQLDDAKKNSDITIQRMVNYFVNIDFDKVDETQKKVSEYLLQGEPEKAKKLLPDKEYIENAENAIHLQKINIANRQEILNKNQAEIDSENTDLQRNIILLAQYFYQWAEAYSLQYEGDSVRYYLEKRANLDTTNVQWQLDAGECSSYPSRSYYYLRALQQALLQYGPAHQDVALCYTYIGDDLDSHPKKVEYYNKALAIYKSLYGDIHPNVADCYYRIGKVYSGDDMGLDYLNKALTTYLAYFGEENHSEIADVYKALGEWHYRHISLIEMRNDQIINDKIRVKENYNKALNIITNDKNHVKEYYNKALEIERVVYGNKSILLTEDYHYVGDVYLELLFIDGIYDALDLYMKALEIDTGFHDISRTDAIYKDYKKIGNTYLILSKSWAAYRIFMPMFIRMEYLQSALENHLKAYTISRICCDGSLAHSGGSNECEQRFNDFCHLLSMNYFLIGSEYFAFGDYNNALSYYYKALLYIDYNKFSYEYIDEDSDAYDSFFNMTVVFPPLIPDDAKYDFEKPINNWIELEILKVIANLYSFLNNDTMAIAYYDKILSVYNRPDSIDLFDYTYYNELYNSEDSITLAILFFNTGTIHQHQGEDSLALTFYEKALDLLIPETNNKQDIAFCYIHMAEIYFKNNKDSVALFYAQSALSLLKDIDVHLHKGICYVIEGDVYKRYNKYRQSTKSYKKALREYEFGQKIASHGLEEELNRYYIDLQEYKSVVDEFGQALNDKQYVLANFQTLFEKEHPLKIYPLLHNEYTTSSFFSLVNYPLYYMDFELAWMGNHHSIDRCAYDQYIRLGTLYSEIDQLKAQIRKYKHQ